VLERHYTFPSRSSALITWRPRCSGEAAVPQRGQAVVKEGHCFNAGTSVACNNRLANSVQTHFFDSGSAAAVGRQERWTQRFFAWLAKGGGRWKTSRATVARGERASWAEKRTGEATYARGRKCENALELRGGRASAESPGQAIAR
jgi:hypothetical protein